MYTRHFGLESLPFHPLSDPHVIFPSNEIREAVCHFRFSRENHEAFFLLTGQVGAGKTTAIRAFLEELPPESPVAVLTNGTLSTRDFLLELASQLKIPKGKRNSKRKLLTRLEAALRVYSREGRPAVLVLDEAHLMSDALLEEVRLLSNLRDQGHPLLYICLVGQSEIVARLRQSHMRPLRQRITSRYAMMPLREPETLEYVAARLRTAGSEKPKEVFHPSAARTLHRMSGGIPREINVLAGQAMMNAYVDHVKNVQRKHVRSVRKDYGFEGVRLPWYRALKLPRVRTFKPADTQPIVAIVRTTKPKGRTSRNPLMSYFPKSLDRGFARNVFVYTASFVLLAAGAAMLLRPGVEENAEPPAPPVSYSVPVSSWATPIPLVSALPQREPVDSTPVAKTEEKPAVEPPSQLPARLSLEDRYPSTLKVESDSPATVWLGDVRIGTAPGTFTAIPPGRYRLKLEADDGKFLQKDVIVTPGSTTFVRASSLTEVSEAVDRVVTSGGDP